MKQWADSPLLDKSAEVVRRIPCELGPDEPEPILDAPVGETPSSASSPNDSETVAGELKSIQQR